MRAVDIGVGHDYDFMVARLVSVERTLSRFPYAGSACGNDGSYFLVLYDVVLAGFLYIQYFDFDREDTLVFSVRGHFCRTEGGVAFHDVKLAKGGVLF